MMVLGSLRLQVRRLKRHSHPDVAALARTLLKRWRAAVRAEEEEAARERATAAAARPGGGGADAASLPGGVESTGEDVRDTCRRALWDILSPVPRPSVPAAAAERAQQPSLTPVTPGESQADGAGTTASQAERGGSGDEAHPADRPQADLAHAAAAAPTPPSPLPCASLVGAVESALLARHRGVAGKEYRAEARALVFNLRGAGEGAASIRRRLVAGELSAEELVGLDKLAFASEAVRVPSMRTKPA